MRPSSRGASAAPARRKPEWNDLQNDPNRFKASKVELMRKKLLMVSQNQEVARDEYRKKLESMRQEPLKPYTPQPRPSSRMIANEYAKTNRDRNGRGSLVSATMHIHDRPVRVTIERGDFDSEAKTYSNSSGYLNSNEVTPDSDLKKERTQRKNDGREVPVSRRLSNVSTKPPSTPGAPTECEFAASTLSSLSQRPTPTRFTQQQQHQQASSCIQSCSSMSTIVCPSVQLHYPHSSNSYSNNNLQNQNIPTVGGISTGNNNSVLNSSNNNNLANELPYASLISPPSSARIAQEVFCHPLHHQQQQQQQQYQAPSSATFNQINNQQFVNTNNAWIKQHQNSADNNTYNTNHLTSFKNSPNCNQIPPLPSIVQPSPLPSRANPPSCSGPLSRTCQSSSLLPPPVIPKSQHSNQQVRDPSYSSLSISAPALRRAAIGENHTVSDPSSSISLDTFRMDTDPTYTSQAVERLPPPRLRGRFKAQPVTCNAVTAAPALGGDIASMSGVVNSVYHQPIMQQQLTNMRTYNGNGLW